MEYNHSINIRLYTNLDDLCEHNKDIDVHGGFTQQFTIDLEEFIEDWRHRQSFDPPVYIEVG